MSSLRVGIVAEGPTDAIVIQAALKAILGRPFIPTTLQPEETLPHVGQGWCGVLKWCRAVAERGFGSIEGDPTLQGFDVVVIHIDADVADCEYADCGPELAGLNRSMPPLPCSQPCPPAQDACDQIRAHLLGWLGIVTTGTRTVFCVPSKAIDAWLAAATLPAGHMLITGLECNARLSLQLANLQIRQRIKKNRREYQDLAPKVTAEWPIVRAICTQAAQFEKEINELALTGFGPTAAGAPSDVVR